MFLLAALVLAGLVTTYSTVPTRFEESARTATLERLEKSGSAVDESYVEASIARAVHDNLHTIFRTALVMSLGVAFILCLLCIRPPHDCGGLNLFNPLAIPLLAVITLFMAISISLGLGSVQGRSVTEFIQLTDEIRAACVSRADILLITLVIPLLLEAIFRGFIFSFLEKTHFTVAIVLSTAAYAAVAYYCFAGYAERSIGSIASAGAAAVIALFVGFVLSVVTWRLRSSIPAMVMHVFIANSGALTDRVAASGVMTLPWAIIVLAVSLALLVFLPVLFAKRMPIFAADFPFTKHHKRMYKWLEGRRTKAKPMTWEEAEAAALEAENRSSAAAAKKAKAVPDKVETAVEAVETKVDAAEEKIEEKIEAAEEKVGEAVKSTVDKAKKVEKSFLGAVGSALKGALSAVKGAFEKLRAKLASGAGKKTAVKKRGGGKN